MPNTIVWEVNAVNEQMISRTQVTGIVWVGATTASDEVVLRARNGSRIWQGRALGDDTYLGIRFADDGVLAKDGLVVETLDSGRLYVYLRSL
jgi:outer membrane protein assembly factor BamB